MYTELRLDRHFISTFSTFLPPRTPSITSTLSSRFISYASSSHSSKYSKQSSHSSKYSKQSPRLSWIKTEPDPHHPAFRPLRRTKLKSPPDGETEEGICLSEKGLIYKLKDAPFEFQYSYTETPKVKPLALREPPFLPFGPKEIPRPWTGRAPLPKSKKNIPEFDSFKPPPPNKKGVKTVQQPGPFLKGEGPRYNMVSREEILGAELTKDEVAELVKGSLKTRTQLNMGRDGLTHNMLDNIHAHWKRRRVCKIKCKGVCTVDMDNVCQQLEEKVGGKVILRKGGVIFLFRGRNYNYKTRPRFPLMLWKPLAPVYPKLIKKVPDGLTLEEANYMRKCGNKLTPICKLGKNGVYVNLVKHVREAFEAWELVRIECKGMNKSDYKKIGAKLKDLVPCVLLSFEFEHLLLWRGNNWKTSLPPVKMDGSDSSTSPVKMDCSDSSTSPVEISGSDSSTSQVEIDGLDSASSASLDDSLLVGTACDNASVKIDGFDDASSASVDTALNTAASDNISDKNERIKSTTDGKITEMPVENNADNSLNTDSTKLSDTSSNENKNDTKTETDCLAGIKLLLNQAMGSGSAVILSEIECKDSDIVYQRSVELSKIAQPGPRFKGNFRKKGPVHKDKVKRKDMGVFALQERAGECLVLYSEKDSKKNINNNRRKKEELLELLPNVVPQGSLGIDELAKLLS